MLRGDPTDYRAYNLALNRLWYSLQSFLVAAANISKALWGKSGKHAHRRRPLRRSLGVTNASPLRPTKMRNYFEHFDEALDDWEAKSPRGQHIDRWVGPIKGMFNPPPHKLEVFRSFDPSTEILTFWGEEYNVRLIAREARRIFPLARTQAMRQRAVGVMSAYP
jgi:hypothetical protein